MLSLFLVQLFYENSVHQVDRYTAELGYEELAFRDVGLVLNHSAGAVPKVVYKRNLLFNYDFI